LSEKVAKYKYDLGVNIMALPTMDLPTYDLEVPSTKKKIKVRPFLVKEEKVLLMALESENEENIRGAVQNLLKSCIQSRIKLENLATFDLEYIFLNIRAVSVGEIVEINVTCQDDNETTVRYNLNLTDVKVTFPKGHSNKIMLTKDTGVIMKYPSFNRFVDSQFANKEVTEDTVLEIIAESIDQIFQGEEVFDESTTTPKEFKEFVESLTNAQMEKLQKFFETSPKLEHKFKVRNPNTDVESDYTISGLAAFFG
tara:strand:- start:4440 stop:5201 length:762 start_codon:yes stop_codon:yes gene_type:complete